jgi:hypothetical protein
MTDDGAPAVTDVRPSHGLRLGWTRGRGSFKSQADCVGLRGDDCLGHQIKSPQGGAARSDLRTRNVLWHARLVFVEALRKKSLVCRRASSQGDLADDARHRVIAALRHVFTTWQAGQRAAHRPSPRRRCRRDRGHVAARDRTDLRPAQVASDPWTGRAALLESECSRP